MKAESNTGYFMEYTRVGLVSSLYGIVSFRKADYHTQQLLKSKRHKFNIRLDASMDKSNQVVSSEKRLDNEPSNDAEPPSAISPSRAPENQISRIDLESILWIVVSGVVMYYTDFWNLVLHDVRVKW